MNKFKWFNVVVLVCLILTLIKGLYNYYFHNIDVSNLDVMVYISLSLGLIKDDIIEKLK